MSREKQLVKNTLIVAVGKIATQFISFFLLPLYTALLTTEEYGVVDLMNTYISLLLPLVFFQIDQAIFRFLIDVRGIKERKKQLVSTAFLTITVQSIIFLLVYLFVSQFISNEYKYFLATNIVAAMFSNITLQIARGVGDNLTYSQGSLISGAGTVILTVLLIWKLGMGAYGMLTASLASNILCFLFIFLKKKLYQYVSITSFNRESLKELWRYSIPLIPNQLSWWIINASDRLIVSFFLGVAMNGVYSASNKFSSICITLFAIFNMTWSESASLYIKDKDASEYFSNIMNISIKLFSSLCLGIIAVMPFVFSFLITGRDFSSAYYQIPILMLATVFNIVVSLLGSVYVALMKTTEIAKTSIYAAIINIIVNLLLIRFFGLFAASFSTLLAYFAMAVYRYKDVQKYIKIYLDGKSVLSSLLLASIALYSYYYGNTILKLFIFMAIFIYGICLNREILNSIFKMFYGRLKGFK